MLPHDALWSCAGGGERRPLIIPPEDICREEGVGRVDGRRLGSCPRERARTTSTRMSPPTTTAAIAQGIATSMGLMLFDGPLREVASTDGDACMEEGIMLLLDAVGSRERPGSTNKEGEREPDMIAQGNGVQDAGERWTA